MLELLDILKEGKEYKEQVFSLYEEAFPEEEKKPEDMLKYLAENGKAELLAVTESGVFIGLVMNLLSEKRALLDYFAIAPEHRNGGYGSRVLRELLKRFENCKYIFEIEMQDERAENAGERKRRKAFYMRNGLKETGLFVRAYDTDFEIITPDGNLLYEEYCRMLLDTLGEETMKMVNPSQLFVSR